MTRKRRPAVAVLAALAAVTALTTGALRYENIRDEEVREIQRLVAGILPGELIQIGGVSEGCGCEEGPACTAQVRVTVREPPKVTGLQLSLLDGKWGLGEMQKWQFRYDDLVASYERRDQAARDPQRALIWRERNNELNRLMSERPVCPLPGAA